MAGKRQARTVRLDWVQTSNRRQLEWAVNYLIKHQVLKPGSYTHEQAAQEIRRLGQSWPLTGPDAPALDKAESRMRGAWASRKHADKHPNTKTFAFRMSKNVQSRLEKMTTRNMNVSQVVEDLINGGEAQHKRIKELEQEVRALKQPPGSKHSLNPLRSRQIISKLRLKNRQFEATSVEWEAVCESLAHELARHEVAFRASGAKEKGQQLVLPPDQELKAMRLQAKWMKAYQAKVKHSIKADLAQAEHDEESNSAANNTPSWE